MSVCYFIFCNTRLHLGFSAKLKIWQVSACKTSPDLTIFKICTSQDFLIYDIWTSPNSFIFEILTSPDLNSGLNFFT